MTNFRAVLDQDERIALVADLLRRVLEGDARIMTLVQGGGSPAVSFTMSIEIDQSKVLAGQRGQPAYETAEDIAVYWMARAADMKRLAEG